MLRGAIPVDGSISRFLGDFFLYWTLVSPYSSGRGDEYRTIKGSNEKEGGKRSEEEKSEEKTKDSRSPIQACLSIY